MIAKVHRIDPEDCVYSWWFRNPANQKSGEPVEVGRLSQYLQGFSTIPGGLYRRISEHGHKR